jgi:hypothetical protein
MTRKVKVDQVLRTVASEELNDDIKEVEVSVSFTFEEDEGEDRKEEPIWSKWVKALLEMATAVLVRIGWAQTSPK